MLPGIAALRHRSDKRQGAVGVGAAPRGDGDLPAVHDWQGSAGWQPASRRGGAPTGRRFAVARDHGIVHKEV